MPLPFVVFVSRHALVLTALFSWRYSRSPWACNGAWTSFLAPCASCSGIAALPSRSPQPGKVYCNGILPSSHFGSAPYQGIT